MPRTKCEHELIPSGLVWNDTGRNVMQCRHCGKYGDASRGYSRYGGHRIIIFRGIAEEIQAGRICAKEDFEQVVICACGRKGPKTSKRIDTKSFHCNECQSENLIFEE